MSPTQVTFIGVKAVALLSYLALVFTVIQSKAERRVRILFSVYLIGTLFWQFASLMVSLSREASMGVLWYNLAVAGAGTANVLFYPFARAFTKTGKRSVLPVVAYASCALIFAVGILGLAWHEVVMGHGGYWVPTYNSGWLLVVGPLWYFFYACGIFVLLRELRRETSPERRNRILYVLAGAVFIVIGLTTNLTSLRDYPVDITFNLISALVTGYAVLRYKLLDIRFVLARSLFYSTLTASLIAAYVGLIFGLERLLQEGVGYSRSTYGIVAVLILAFIFLPLRNALQKLIDRVFFREKGDYQKATQLFSREIASMYEEEPIVKLACESIARTVETSFVSLSLYDPASERFVVSYSCGRDAKLADGLREGARSPLVRWLAKERRHLVRDEALNDPELRPLVEGDSSILAPATSSIVVPVMLDARLLGLFIMGQKLSGLIYNPEDLSFLATIANQTATALDKSEIFLKIRRRLSEQTLLFVLSQKFRGSSDVDSVMASIVQVLKSFLNCEHCAIVYFDKAREARTYSQDRLSSIAAELAATALTSRVREASASIFDEYDLRFRVRALASGRSDVSEREALVLGSLSYRPLADGDSLLGILAITDRTGGASGFEQENELLRTIQAIVSQGVVLYRTIVDLLNLESYNEKILDSLNDMGDTLIIMDRDGLIRKVNKAACKLLESTEEELVGAPIDRFVADHGGILSPEGIRHILSNNPVSDRELSYRSRSGAAIPMLFSGSAMVSDDGKNRELIGIARDMTERRKAEDATKNLILVKEIHHRIKNNLQVISSLLILQSSYVSDESVKEMFRESQFRVRSMALIHEKLYRSQTPSTIDFSEYAADLTRTLLASFSLSRSKVQLDTEISGITLGMDSAVPCGLIITELVSNALKHAFPGERAGRIKVSLVRRDGSDNDAGVMGGAADDKVLHYELLVEDDGVGFPEGRDIESYSTLGLKIVTTLTRQLHGEVRMSRSGGTRMSVAFSETR